MNVTYITMQDGQVRTLRVGGKSQDRRVVTGPNKEALDFIGGAPHEVSGSADQVITQQWLDGKLYICSSDYPEEGAIPLSCPYGQPGDQVWVRESYAPVSNAHGPCGVLGYRADITDWDGFGHDDPWWLECDWKPSIRMPRWASRLTLYLSDVRVQRVQDISEQNAWAEGAPRDGADRPFPIAKAPPGSNWLEDGWDCARDWFADTWDSINAKRGYSWACNPWVWALTFDVIHSNVEEVLSNPKFYLPRTRPQQVDAYAKARGRAM